MIARVAVEISLGREFDYQIPEELETLVKPGCHVEVPFGHSTTRGFVLGLKAWSHYEQLKPIHKVMGTQPLIDDQILRLAEWMSTYYASPIEQCLKAVLPSAVRKKEASFKEQLMATPLELATQEEALNKLRKQAPRQAEALDVLLANEEMSVRDLCKVVGSTRAALRGLERKGFIRIDKGVTRRDPHKDIEFLQTADLPLSEEQENALSVIKKSIETGSPPVTLLFGVTGSGKTEVYLQAIKHVLSQDKGAIVLVPEISLTPQTVERFRGRFGADIAVLHSHLSEGERHDEWHRLKEGKARIAIGARSAVFAPVKNPGIIVVDEEHESSYKQEEAPRYHARDVAVMRGRLEQCAVVLGSATPSLESYWNGLKGKYTTVTLSKRIEKQQLPEMRIVDLRLQPEGKGILRMFAHELVEAMRKRLERGEQCILFLNRRGYSTSLMCTHCGYTAECHQCSVTLTYHKKACELRCHICGDSRPAPSICPNPDCGESGFRYAGIGTEKVENALKVVLPEARVQRVDSDTMTNKHAYQKMMGDFRTGKTQILLGTQMIAKGLHFPNVTLVGVILADGMLSIPDFRASERGFQLLTQVAGRAGRGDINGQVYVQTYNPFHPAIQFARRMDYEGFIDQEMEVRKQLMAPPLRHLMVVTLRGPIEEEVMFYAQQFYLSLKRELQVEHTLLEPMPAPMARIKGDFRYQVLCYTTNPYRMSQPASSVADRIKWPHKIKYTIDVDAYSLL